MAERKFPYWATDDTLDIGNGDPNKIDPGAAKQATGWTVEKPLLQTMNWLQNLFGHFVKANNQIVPKATGYEAEAGENIVMDNSSGVSTMLLPEFPVDGQWVNVSGVVEYSTNEVIVDGNGNDIMVDADQSCVLDADVDDTIFRFWFDEPNDMWKIRMQAITGKIL